VRCCAVDCCTADTARAGFVRWHEAADDEAKRAHQKSSEAIGLEQSQEVLDWLWVNKFRCAASTHPPTAELSTARLSAAPWRATPSRLRIGRPAVRRGARCVQPRSRLTHLAQSLSCFTSGCYRCGCV
jgi:hypothetical protein